jgi:hypothetical protein
MAAYSVDQSALAIPGNFIVRDYVPQNEILRRADAAITHCGMNSMNDILVHEVPFVSLPLGAPEEIRSALKRVIDEPAFLASGVSGTDMSVCRPGFGRDVATKVSAQQFSDRFEREARAH